MNCVIKYRLALTTFLLLSMNSLASGQDLNYQSFAEQKIGKDKSGLILRDLGKAEWEILAVGNASIEQREGVSDAQGYREALLMAGAQSRRTLAEFIGGIRVKGFTAAKTESQVLVDGSQKENTQSKFSEFWKSQQQQDVYAFLRGTRQVGEWKSTDGRQVFLAVAVCPKDISQSLSVSQSIEGVQSGEKFKVVGTEGTDMSPRRVQAWGMAAKTTDSVAAARRAAIYDALRLAVESVAGMTLSGRTSVRNLDRLKSSISSMTAGVVKSFMVLKEEDQGGQYRVLIEAEVQSALSGNIKVVMALLGNPPIAVHSSRPGYNENTDSLRVTMAARGLILQNLPSHQAEYNELRNVSLSVAREAYHELIMKDAGRIGIPIVAWCEDEERSSVQAFSTVTGERIGSVGLWKGGFFNNRKEINEGLVNSVVAYLEDEAFNGTHIRCELSNSMYKQTSALRKIVETLDNCKSLKQTAMDASAKTAVFTVRYAGTVQEFLDSLMEAAGNSMDDALKKLDVSKQEGNVVSLSL